MTASVDAPANSSASPVVKENMPVTPCVYDRAAQETDECHLSE